MVFRPLALHPIKTTTTIKQCKSIKSSWKHAEAKLSRCRGSMEGIFLIFRCAWNGWIKNTKLEKKTLSATQKKNFRINSLLIDVLQYVLCSPHLFTILVTLKHRRAWVISPPPRGGVGEEEKRHTSEEFSGFSPVVLCLVEKPFLRRSIVCRFFFTLPYHDLFAFCCRCCCCSPHTSGRKTFPLFFHLCEWEFSCLPQMRAAIWHCCRNGTGKICHHPKHLPL